MEERVLVHTTDKTHIAEMLLQYLSDNGIIAFTIDKRDSNYHFGDIEFYVMKDDVIRTKLLINKFES
ncbi:MAG: hypothetical protein K9H49_13100 [Bacteroidales bacterium]|nr:hypothetical protein [Bacteroidales bacterium]MCF8390241.1 hypothetical protein [Bacteroidales bacterium]